MGDPGSIPGLGRSPGEGNGNPLVFLPGKSHRWRSLVNYSPWRRKESDRTEQLHFHFSLSLNNYPWKCHSVIYPVINTGKTKMGKKQILPSKTLQYSEEDKLI